MNSDDDSIESNLLNNPPADVANISIGEINVNTDNENICNSDNNHHNYLNGIEIITIQINEDLKDRIFEINEIIKSTSIDGRVEIEWAKMNEFIQYKFKIILNEMYRNYASDGFLFTPNSDEEHRIKLQENKILIDDILISLENFKRIPFTMQRICELLNDPFRYYKNPYKFLFAFNKLVDIDNY